MDKESPVYRAIALLGGSTQASWVLHVSVAAIYRWFHLGRVPDARSAILLARETARRGHAISIEALAGLENGEAPTDGGTPLPLLRGGPTNGAAPRSRKRAEHPREIGSVYANRTKHRARRRIAVAASLYGRRTGRPFQKEVHGLRPNVRIVLVGDVAI